MRKGILGSIAALAAGAGAAWGQAPVPPAGDPPPPAAIGEAGPPPGGVPGEGGYPGGGGGGGGGFGPAPVLMPPLAVGPPGDPLGLGPMAGNGPPPGPMYPMPGPYAAHTFQPPPPGAPGPGGGGGYGNAGAPHWWFGGEYLLWFAREQPVPYPLITTSAPSQSGLLGRSSTLQLVNGSDIGYGTISGFRLTGGFYGDADRRFGLEVSAFYTEFKEFNRDFFTSPVGIPLLARPFIDTSSGLSSLVTSSPELGGGNAFVSTSTTTWGGSADAVWNLFRSNPGTKCWNSVDFMLGYRFLELKERFTVGSNTNLTAADIVPIIVTGPFGVPISVGFQIIPIPVPVGGVVTGAPATIQIVDRITTRNDFNGINVGLRHEFRYGMFSLNSTFKLAMGNMHQVLDIQGSTSFVDPRTGRAGSAFGGLYANAANIGRYDNDEFAAIPELTFNLGVNVTRRMTAHIGYNFLYVSDVLRPGNHLNPVIDSSTVPFSPNYGRSNRVPADPISLIQDEFYLHGVNFGLTIRY